MREITQEDVAAMIGGLFLLAVIGLVGIASGAALHWIGWPFLGGAVMGFALGVFAYGLVVLGPP